MIKSLAWIKPTAQVIWKHTSALVAVLLIITALIGGYLIGRPPTPDVPSTQPDDDPPMYTCSMHPSVRLPDPDAKCQLCGMDLVLVTDSGSGDLNRGSRSTKCRQPSFALAKN